MSTSPHDALFKSAFGQVDIARSELAAVLPREIIELLDLASLEVSPGSFIDEELRHTHSDLLYAVKTADRGEALVHVVFEHQSTFDPRMPLRLLRYVVRIWERWSREFPENPRLPIVLPVLLHHGPKGWQAEETLEAMLDASPALLAATRPYVPHFRFVLDDLGARSLDELASRTVHALGHLVQMAFWSARSLERLEAASPLMQALASTLPDDERTRALLQQLYVYVLLAAHPDVDVREVRTILLKVAGPRRHEDVMNAGEQLIHQGLLQGLERGLVQGRAEALTAIRAALSVALSARGLSLSEVGAARIAGCTDVAVLTSWLARAITASAEADVFND